MYSKPFRLLLLILAMISPSHGCSWNEQELLSMSVNELKQFFKHQEENYYRITDLIYGGEKRAHLPEPNIFENSLRESANQLKKTCFKITDLTSKTTSKINNGNLEKFKMAYLPKALERYGKLSLNLESHLNLYYQSLAQMKNLAPWPTPLGTLKVFGGLLLLGYSTTTFLMDVLYLAEHNALDNYGRGLTSGIGLCLLYSGLMDTYYEKKQACSLEQALNDADEIWTLTADIHSFDFRPLYRFCTLI